MKVAELKQLLEDFDDNDTVIIPADADGTTYSPVGEITTGYYFSESEWSGDFVSQEDADGDEDVSIEESESAVCLWPSN